MKKNRIHKYVRPYPGTYWTMCASIWAYMQYREYQTKQIKLKLKNRLKCH